MHKITSVVIALSLSSAGAQAAEPSALLRYAPSNQAQLIAGARTHRIELSEGAAIQAAAKGGFSLATPDGKRVFLRYVGHRLEDNGDLTWRGAVATALGEQTATLTFGSDAVFGTIPTSSGYALRIVSEGGKAYLVEIDENAVQRSMLAHGDSPTPIDYVPAPSSLRKQKDASTQSQDRNQTLAAAAAAAPTVDVFVAYTAGLRSRLGSAAAMKTRINHVVSVTNQAYADSGVKGRIRLVGTGEVSYPDAVSLSVALKDLADSGQGRGPASLAKIKSWRADKKADLVSLMMNFHSSQKACGLAYTLGYDETPITAEDAPYGFGTVADGKLSNGTYCDDRTFAHEIGHNLGLLHDRDSSTQDANGDAIPGATSYAFGWRKNLVNNKSFATIMAYPTGSQRTLLYFSSPTLKKCNGDPCGVAGKADNVKALNLTMSKVAAFK